MSGSIIFSFCCYFDGNREEVMKETLETLLSGVASVSSDIEQYSDWAEQNRRLHQDSFSAIVRAKVPRLFLPESLGGLEVDPVTCARVCEEIALIDSAAA